MNFNSITMTNLSDLRLVRYIKHGQQESKMISVYLPKKRFVFVIERIQYGMTKANSDIPRLLLQLGNNENVVKFLGYAHLDGRAYLLLQHYELGDLQTQLQRYKKNNIEFSEPVVWSLMHQIMKTCVSLLKIGIYPYLTPKNILLEEKIPLHYPEIFFIDECDLKRRFRVSFIIQKVTTTESISNIKPDMSDYKLSAVKSLNEAFQKNSGTSFDPVLNTSMYQKKKELDDEVFDPSYEPQSNSFKKKPSKLEQEKQKELVNRYEVEQMPTYLNTQHVDEKLFKSPQSVKKSRPISAFQQTINDLSFSPSHDQNFSNNNNNFTTSRPQSGFSARPSSGISVNNLSGIQFRPQSGVIQDMSPSRLNMSALSFSTTVKQAKQITVNPNRNIPDHLQKERGEIITFAKPQPDVEVMLVQQLNEFLLQISNPERSYSEQMQELQTALLNKKSRLATVYQLVVMQINRQQNFKQGPSLSDVLSTKLTQRSISPRMQNVDTIRFFKEQKKELMPLNVEIWPESPSRFKKPPQMPAQQSPQKPQLKEQERKDYLRSYTKAQDKCQRIIEEKTHVPAQKTEVPVFRPLFSALK
ncbi:Kinase [Hexamita inflata]|uniref:Kinase n=1 Tax=Hexamita inflata TaxID=28002 RepID=A0AA86NMT6_9EUKA|nr:Kinase [Hexamita inflata]